MLFVELERQLTEQSADAQLGKIEAQLQGVAQATRNLSCEPSLIELWTVPSTSFAIQTSPARQHAAEGFGYFQAHRAARL